MISNYPDQNQVSANTVKIMEAVTAKVGGEYVPGLKVLKLLTETYVNDLYTESRASRKVLSSMFSFEPYDILEAKISIRRDKYFKLLFDIIYPEHQQISNDCGRRKDKLATEQGQYTYIPPPMYSFDNILKYIETKYGKRKYFFDVGCGIGDKALLAYISGLFEQVGGIEYDETSFNVANYKTSRLINYKHRMNYPQSNKTVSKFILGDAFTHNFSTYDTIYLYCPIKTHEGMSKLLSHIYDTMKKDSIIFFKNANLRIDQWEREHNLGKTWVEKADCYVIVKR